MNPCTPALIDASHAAMMQRGISISVAACGSTGLPAVARALGCRVSPERCQVTVLVSRLQAAEVIACVAQTGALAAVFSDPSSHKAIQLKGGDASARPATPDDCTVVRSYRAAFISELSPLGYEPALVLALLDCADADLIALSFTPDAAFSQTPGPGAGQSLQVGA